MWKASASRKQVDDHEVVFDPTETCPEHFVNLFMGISMEPKSGDVTPIIELMVIHKRARTTRKPMM